MHFEFDSGIYKITSPSGKVYIGQTYDLVNRFKVYLKHKCKLQPRLYNSLQKYGFVNHKFEILEYVSIAELNDRERYYQDLFNVIGKNGLNCKLTKTNDRNGAHSFETIQKIKATRGNCKGYKMTDEQKNAIRERMLGTKLSEATKAKLIAINLGKKVSEETKAKMRATHLLKKGMPRNESHCKAISDGKSNYILDLTTGVYFLAVYEACEAYNLNRRSLCNYLNGSRGNKTNLIYAK